MNTHTRGHLKLSAKIALALLLSASASFAADALPAWAYGTPGGGGKPANNVDARPNSARTPQAVPDNNLKHLSGSSSEFTRAQIGDRFGPADWYPGDHPEMPDIVAHGRKPDIWACALCHYPNGKGRPENAGVAGLPVSYFIHQMHDFRDGLRKSADPQKKNTNLMIVYAKAMTDDEIKAAAEYFGSMKWTPWIKVMEASSGSQDAPLRRHVPSASRRRERGAWSTDYRDAGRCRSDRRVAQSPVGFHRVCTGRQYQKRRSPGNDRRRQNRSLHCLSWSRFEGDWSGARHCGPLAKLPGAAALRHAAK